MSHLKRYACWPAQDKYDPERVYEPELWSRLAAGQGYALKPKCQLDRSCYCEVRLQQWTYDMIIGLLHSTSRQACDCVCWMWFPTHAEQQGAAAYEIAGCICCEGIAIVGAVLA
mgnify:CR=1 FL=1